MSKIYSAFINYSDPPSLGDGYSFERAKPLLPGRNSELTQ